MNRLARLAIRLYPASWRARYGAELEALVQDSGSGWCAVLDLMKGALTMRVVEAFSTARSLPLMVACGLLGAVLGSFVFLLAPPQLVSSTSIAIQGSETSQAVPSTVTRAAFSDQNLQGLAKRFDLYSAPQEDQPAADSLRRFRRDISVTLTEPEVPARTEQVSIGERTVAFSDRGAMRLSFRYPDERKAQTVTAELARLIIEANLLAREADGRADASTIGQRYRVTGPPQRLAVREFVVHPVGLGLGLGVLAGIIVATLRRRPLNPSANQ
jgi:hypothetical protein